MGKVCSFQMPYCTFYLFLMEGMQASGYSAGCFSSTMKILQILLNGPVKQILRMDGWIRKGILWEKGLELHIKEVPAMLVQILRTSERGAHSLKVLSCLPTDPIRSLGRKLIRIIKGLIIQEAYSGHWMQRRRAGLSSFSSGALVEGVMVFTNPSILNLRCEVGFLTQIF